MLRDDESRVPAREMARWLVPLLLVLLGVGLFFSVDLDRPTGAVAPAEAGTP